LVEKVRQCASNGCSKEGIFPLTIIYLHKIGWFCHDCREDLREAGLIAGSENGGQVDQASKQRVDQTDSASSAINAGEPRNCPLK
jgi:hypothetical protein